jgi:hypothetical protein
MLPHDPEREASGRSIAAILMARLIKEAGAIHPETILTEIGALAGFAAQMSIRKGLIEPQNLDAGSVLIEVVAKNGDKFYFSDLLNWILFENNAPPRYSIWSYIVGAVPDAAHAHLPDVTEIVSHAARTVGSRQFGLPRLPREHMPHKLPRAALEQHWAIVRDELVASARDPLEWPYDLAWAAQWQMLTSRGSLPLPLAAAVVMEAAIPMSKVDPRSIPGA